jgi:hypothetical protein
VFPKPKNVEALTSYIGLFQQHTERFANKSQRVMFVSHSFTTFYDQSVLVRALARDKMAFMTHDIDTARNGNVSRCAET